MNTISKERLQKLIAAAKSMPKEDTSDLNTEKYDFHRPHYFNQPQLLKLDNFAEELASAIAKQCTEILNSKFKASPTGKKQIFAENLMNQAKESDSPFAGYNLVFSTQQEQFGYINIPISTAAAWLGQMLGSETDQDQQEKELSEMENKLLIGAASAIVTVLSDYLKTITLDIADMFFKDQMPLNVTGTEPLYEIGFSLIKEQEENAVSEFSFVFLSHKLNPITEKQEFQNKTAKQTSREAMLKNVYKIPITIKALLGSTILSFSEAIELKPKDILILDTKADDLIDVTVNNKTILRGRPAKSAGKFAVVIKELCQNS